MLRKQGRHGLLRGVLMPGSRRRRDHRPPDLSEDFKLWCKKNAKAGNSGSAAVTGGSVIGWIIGWRRRPGPE
jgi:hypothetical protein